MDDTDAMSAIGATDIRKVMKSQGPIVTTVILRCPPPSSANINGDGDDKEDSKPEAVEESKGENQSKGKTDDDGDNDAKIEASETPTPRVILRDLIEEVTTDTTPSKSKVAEILGGPFTFLGQYEEEGIVLMVRNLPDDLEADLKDIYDNSEDDNEDEDKNKVSFSFSEQLSKNFNIKELKALCFQRDIDTADMKEKQELVQALVNYQKRLAPYNTHQLQPPLHKARVRGDIVVMKVAETAEELGNEKGTADNGESKEEKDANVNDDSNNNVVDDADEEKESPIESTSGISSKKVIAIPSNNDFFLNYSKEEYIKFASRTDIPEHEIELQECDEEDTDESEVGENGEASMMGVHDGDDDEDDDDDDEENDENDKSAMFNLVMNEVLRQYREENGRGPNTKELLELRSNIARELGVEISHEIDGDWDKMAKENQVPSAKKIFFTKEADRVREYVPNANEYPSDKDDDDDEDYDDEHTSDVARSLEDDYKEADDGEYSDQPPSKRLKISEEQTDGGDSKPAATST
mmetsp:Transcript_1584/g.3515  ORF Transcript_1584/g.3515 Transcript_1584/m.3515 type:complete len:523 (+) Transcript_1584:291-1859(+)